MRTLRASALLLGSLLALSSCASAGVAPEMAGDSGHYDAASEEFDAAGDVEDSGREIITTGFLTLVTDDVSETTDEIVAVTETMGGLVQSRHHSAQSEYQSENAWLSLRVPAAELTALTTAVEGLGEVRELQISTDDVTRHGRDLDARIGALEASTERLLELMAEADSSEALIAAESALSERQAQLDALRSERRYLSDQVAMSTLEVNILPTSKAEFDRGGFVGGVLKGWNALVNSASSLLVGLGAALPWVVVLGVPLAGITWLIRKRRARRRSTRSTNED